MKTYVALLRGINLGGTHMLPMAELRLLLEENGCVDVRTYIQSGNVVFRTTTSNVARLAGRLTESVSKRHGFAPRVMVLSASELESAVAGNPFSDACENPKSLHLFFLSERPGKPDLAACETMKAGGERFALKGTIFYLHTPDGFGISKLAGRVEKHLGVATTARNWRTVMTLLEMVRGEGRA